MVCLGGLHGNEPAGVSALARILERLGRRGMHVGEFVALVGNRAAHAAGRRFVDSDLNRLWTGERVDALRAGPVSDLPTVEEVEQRELLDELEAIVSRARGPVMFLDLHTTSGGGGPFVSVGDTLQNREFALTFPTPLVLGLEEQVEGTLAAYLTQRGYLAVVFESGQHDDPRSVVLAEAAVWIALEHAGLRPTGTGPEPRWARRLLEEESRGLPRAVEMRYRHPVELGDEFRMKDGYENFQHVAQDEVLGYDRRGAVHSPETAMLLMPLYQELGSDGFFVVRPFRPMWLALSKALQVLQAGRFVHILPGIHRDPRRPDVLVVNRRVARWYALELFHLLGYRKQWDEGERVAVTRRPHDPPPGPPLESPSSVAMPRPASP